MKIYKSTSMLMQLPKHNMINILRLLKQNIILICIMQCCKVFEQMYLEYFLV